MTARPSLRLLHTSDVHLGAYDSGHGSEDRRAALEEMFRRVVDVGLSRGVDFVVIAGDFIDNARVRDETLQFAAEQIARAQVPVVLLPGNHDHVGAGSIYDRFDIESGAPNLRLMRSPGGETVALAELDVELWGRSHTEQLADFSPLGDGPARGKAAWQIAVAHGHFIHPRAALHHSFHIREEHLRALDRDYVALGHWEQLTRVAGGHVTAAYSGAPLGLGGGSADGRVLIVDLERDGSVRLTAESLDGAPAITHDDLPYLRGV